MIAFVLGLIGIGFALNGLMMLPSVSTALHQQVAAIYLVGGVLVFGVAVMLARALTMVDHLSVIARAGVADQPPLRVKSAEGDHSRASSSLSAAPLDTCPNCGRQNPKAETLCACGLNLKR